MLVLWEASRCSRSAKQLKLSLHPGGKLTDALCLAYIRPPSPPLPPLPPLQLAARTFTSLAAYRPIRSVMAAAALGSQSSCVQSDKNQRIVDGEARV